MRTLLPLFLIICLTLGTQGFADGESVRQQIKQWVQQLGDESFLVRQRAETLLIRAGIQAYPELQRAKQSHDVEIVRRTEYVLSQIEQTLRDTEHRETADWIQLYTGASDLASKARIIWYLADPIPTYAEEKGFEKCEGLQTLCRLIRFEESSALRLEVAKTLIASPPFSPMQRQKWYQHIQDNFFEPGEDELFQSLALYAKLWCDLNDASEKKTPAFQERVREVSAKTLRLLERPENSIQRGSSVDILLHYAVAELQDAAGLTDDRDQTVSQALAIQPQPMPTSELIQLIGGLEEGLAMNEHLRVGRYLKMQFRLHWARAHFRRVIETGNILPRMLASVEAIRTAELSFDYALAAVLWDEHIEILNSPEYTKDYDPSKQLLRAQKQKAYCLAEKAASEGNWAEVRDIFIQASVFPLVSMDMMDMDLVILAYRLCSQLPDIESEFSDAVETSLKQMWQHIVLDYESLPAMRGERAPMIFNAAAWLLANTDGANTEGDYQSALTLVETALKSDPDNASYLDTLAHAYFLGGKIDEAISVQEEVVRLAPEAVIFRKALERFKQVKAHAKP